MSEGQAQTRHARARANQTASTAYLGRQGILKVNSIPALKLGEYLIMWFHVAQSYTHVIGETIIDEETLSQTCRPFVDSCDISTVE